ncbi:MAG: HNH nuclease family protein [Desulfuromonadaceae bacterium]|nr:HNH nuclease family protein [Desulfuromonadaceae bacterium]
MLTPEEVLAQAREDALKRQESYREQALKLFPHVCGRCCREFEGKKLRELTVHHRDHNHDNNPSDGSNWELLCLYCHEQEHVRSLEQQRADDGPSVHRKPTLSHSPFDALSARFKPRR